MNEYRGKHAPSTPWAVSSTATVSSRRGRHQRKNKIRRIWIYLLVFLFLVMLAYPFLEARFLTVDTVSLRSSDLPLEGSPLRIVYLSDIHWGYWYTDGDLSRLLTKINSLRPDLVLFGGDYATDYDSALRFFRLLPSLPRIHARYGVFGVLGETDCLPASEDQVVDPVLLSEAMTNAGVIPLINQTVPVYLKSSRIFIAGLDDSLRGKPDFKKVASSVSPSDYVILLAHNPSVIQSAQQTLDGSGSLGWFDLGLFGHTHGGQMKGFSGILGLGDDVPERYLSGWLTENRVDLLISRGVGTSVFPARLFCSPQIHLVEIKSD